MYTVEEIASKLQISENNLRRLLRKKTIKGVKVGKEWRISEYELKKITGE